MRSSRLAIIALVVALVAAFAVPGAIACDKTKTDTASTKSCDPANCDPAACADKTAATTASTTTASTTTAGSTCSKTAAASTTVAGVGCTKGAAAQTAGASGCSSSASAAKYDIAIETVKLPSGALAVMYRGNDANTVAMLQSAANGSVADFGCQNVQKMASAENCSVEMASIEGGLMFLCTSDDAELIASIQKDYEVVQAVPVEDEQGE